jgi:hypothetical protein
MGHELFQYPDGKTNYQIINELGEKTTITLEKWVADIIQLEFDDVHGRLQKAYDKILNEKPELSRRERGNAIRQMAERSANNFQVSKKKVLGWNDDELFALL